MKLEVRELLNGESYLVVDYFLKADKKFLNNMGVDTSKLPDRDKWIEKIECEKNKPARKKEFYYVIWLAENRPVGHSNISDIICGESAKFHLHLWNDKNRKRGFGREFLWLTFPFYFDKFQLKKLVAEPFAFNPAPNRLLEKIGFEFVKVYETIPGWINDKQLVNKWLLTKERFVEIAK